jgi:MFS family permease
MSQILMYFSIIMFSIGSALCGAAQSMEWLIAARAVQGLGGGGIMALSTILVGDIVPIHERGSELPFVSLL